MDPSTFTSLLAQLDKESFSDGKKGAVRSYQSHHFSGDQVIAILKKLTFPSDKVEVMKMLGPQLCPISGHEGKAIVEAFVHGSDKVTAVGLIANRINDPVNKYVVLEAIVHHFDKQKCREILDKATPCSTGGPPPQPSQYQPGPVQPGVPTGISVNFGNPASGMGLSINMQPNAPSPHNPPPPGGNYPPQAGTYPPQAGTYPPQTGTYPPQAGNYPPQSGNYPPQAGTYPPQAGTYPPPAGNYPPQAGTYPPPAGNYPPQAGTYPPQAGNYPPQAGTYPPQAGNYPPQAGTYPPPAGNYAPR